jgi:hypothetical protein
MTDRLEKVRRGDRRERQRGEMQQKEKRRERDRQEKERGAIERQDNFAGRI